jgi:hypothetical protein
MEEIDDSSPTAWCVAESHTRRNQTDAQLSSEPEVITLDRYSNGRKVDVQDS